jgi:ribonuclease P protein component
LPAAPSRFGITVSRKLGRATVRNRIRRRTREILRRHVEELGSGWDIVINPRRTVLEAEFALLDEELMGLLRRLTSPGSPGTPRSRMREGPEPGNRSRNRSGQQEQEHR